MGSEDKKEQFQCELCPKYFAEKRYLTKHIGRVHPDGKVKKKKDNSMQCPICRKTFPRYSHLSRHQLSCMNIRSFECPFCEEKFQQKPHLLRHVGRRHPDENSSKLGSLVRSKKPDPQAPSTSKSCETLVHRHLCLKCGHIFTDTHDLVKHVRNLHHPLVCHHCNRIFYGNQALKKHELMTRTGRYTCSCGAGFATIRTLRNHENACRRRGEFMCLQDECKQLFCQRVQLDRHWNKIHFLKKSCDLCAFEASAPLRLATHVEVEHQIKVCGFCGLRNPDDKHIPQFHWRRLKKTVKLATKLMKEPVKAGVKTKTERQNGETALDCSALENLSPPMDSVDFEDTETDFTDRIDLNDELNELAEGILEEDCFDELMEAEPVQNYEDNPPMPSYELGSLDEEQNDDPSNFSSVYLPPGDHSQDTVLNLVIQVPENCIHLNLADHITNELALAFPDLRNSNVYIPEEFHGRLLSLYIPVAPENTANMEKWLNSPIYL